MVRHELLQMVLKLTLDLGVGVVWPCEECLFVWPNEGCLSVWPRNPMRHNKEVVSTWEGGVCDVLHQIGERVLSLISMGSS